MFFVALSCIFDLTCETDYICCYSVVGPNLVICVLIIFDNLCNSSKRKIVK